jgi:hypothetical protein
MIFGNEFVTTSCALVSSNSPSQIAKMEEGATDLASLLDWIYESIREPFLISGFVLFTDLKATHMTRAPIVGEKYFFRKGKILSDSAAKS